MTDGTIEQKLHPVAERGPLVQSPETPAVKEEAVLENEPTGEEAENAPPEERSRQTTSTPERPTLKRKSAPVMPLVRDPVVIKIEKILESGVGDAYNRLSPIAKQEFKMEGEQTAMKIRELLKSAHVKVKKIFQLIMEWLKLLPGVNHFFLEQEAKIKTDRVLGLHQPKD